MGMVNWFRTVFNPTGQGDFRREDPVIAKTDKARLLDLTDGFYLVEAARRWGAQFVRRSRLDFKDFRREVRTHRKVRQNLIPSYDIPDIVDEVTEKIVDTSRHDSRISQLFS
jgi:hypothetical protein